MDSFKVFLKSFSLLFFSFSFCLCALFWSVKQVIMTSRILILSRNLLMALDKNPVARFLALIVNDTPTLKTFLPKT